MGESYRVKESDLIGQLEGFPLKVVQKMVDYQIEQGCKIDVSVFQKDIIASTDKGGFDWHTTEEGREFWWDVISEKNFDLFFQKQEVDQPTKAEEQPKVIDWEQRRFELIKAIAPSYYQAAISVLSHGGKIEGNDIDTYVADMAVNFADKLIKRIKEE